MRRFKTFIGTLLVIFLLVVATASTVRTNESDTTISATVPEHRVVDEKEAKRYKLRQQKLKGALKAYFEKAIANGDIVGAGVSIVEGDSILISDGFGKRSIDGKAKIDGTTIFRLGSLSKGFAGVLAAGLKSEGKLSWNDKLIDYIPEFKFGDPINTAKITVSHILSHTSGTPYHSFTNLVEAGLPMATIARRFDEVTPLSEPGQLYSYQNAMFALSQEVMRKATGKAVQRSLQNRFFTPLGMATVSMDHETLLNSDNVAIPHARARKGWRSLPLKDRYYNAVVAGGINASSLDMAKWMRFLLGHNPEVMEKADITEVFKPFVALNGHNKYYQRWPGHLQSYYGFGWRIHRFQGMDTNKETTIWHHGGSVNNYRNEIALYPEDDLGICVLLNGNSKLARTVIPDVRAIVQRVDSSNEIPTKG
ncbi:beta-lactamase family protein [Flavobacteriaceae bacterium TP-CH-4]|uniref:Beta-lactamase family protein n=1 Tax=Pelagihabitans pacificus TaxID=2696054 RepID=A0A967B100_9FLAO|nr:serine hydrolase domain-containing protein [Pelagihabitans pacificus]NHF60116.1 beta-lactamase family protein [Pelagihabitans pacificus]